MLAADLLAARDDRRIFDGIAQLAHVPMPGASHQFVQHSLVDRRVAAPRDAALPQEMLHQGGDILAMLAQRGDMDREDVQPEEEVFAELPRGHHRAQRAIRGREEPDVHGPRLRLADRFRAVPPDDEEAASTTYDEIWSNPPIRIGKLALHELLLRWFALLSPGGRAVMVVGKNLGGDSLHAWLTDQGYPTTRLASAKGFRDLESQPAK